MVSPGFSGLSLLQDLLFYRTYAETKSSGFKETFDETVDRSMQMHIDKFPQHSDAIVKAFSLVRNKVLVPSMRAIEDSTPILTKKGWKTVGEVEVGDYLYASDGKETLVKEVIHFENKELFDVCFDDHVSIRACDEHLWILKTNDDLKNRKEFRVEDTKFIREHLKQGDRANIRIPLNSPISREDSVLPVHPYVMGYWLGNGYASGRSICCDVPDAEFITGRFRELGFPSVPSDSSNIWCHHVRNLRSALVPLGVIGGKFVPKAYLSGSKEQLLQLLQGLMDSDGNITKEGRCSFANTNIDIIEAVEEALSYLGVRYIRTETEPRSPNHQKLYSVLFFTDLEVFSLPRKKQNIRTELGIRNRYRRVESVESAGKGNATCFVVDSIDRSFLVGKQMVVTHNCFQFAGRAVKRENLRMYNCSWMPIDNVDTFGDIAYALMVGAGVGFSVQKCHISQLPAIKRPYPDYWVINDDREGWADSFKQLVLNPGLEFVYGFIRPAGARLSSGGTASGSDVLKISHAKIREILLGAVGRKLRSIEAHDIVCHIADCVVAGGSRRSATLSQFDADDEEMLNCKAGNWWEKNPQRGRANNSATIYRDDKDFGGKFYQAMYSSISSNCGEPGILLSNSKDYGYNPCLPAYATVLTPEGIRTFADIDAGSIIWSGKRWTKVLKKWSTGIKEVFEYKTESRCVFQGTENHRIVQNGKKIEVKDATHIDTCVGPSIITSKIIESSKIDVCEVFDITVDDEEHAFWSGGCIVSNCGEISLKAVCNLTEINAAACSTKSQFLEAVNAATFIGKLQSTYTDFHYVQPRFRQWAEEEMLLGVSITGQADAWNLIGDADVLMAGAAEALRTDEEWAAVLGIPLAKRICTTKPSGSTSLLLGVSSGIHAAHSPFYIRRVRLDKTDPVAKYLIEQVGVGEACSGSIVEYDKFAPHNVVVSVPVAKSGSIVRNQESAVSLMNRAKHVRDNWILPTHREGPNTHNVSLTVNYRQNEIGEMIDWMYKNRDSYAGISILPDSDSSFVQLPFEEISIQDYVTWKDKFQDVKFDLSSINFGGTVDTRQGEMACAGGACQISSL
jgi:hypothetical protein